MKERLQGLVAGVMIGAISLGGVVYATTGTKSIEVLYDNIKVYKDNVLCETRDANGTVVEPFIYNGTTYMPVRGTANLAGMDVTWDGNTRSVYLWDEIPANGTFFLDVCPPYDTDDVSVYTSGGGRSFNMAGEKYSNGLVLSYADHSSALFNLNGKFSTIECTIGHVDGDNNATNSVSFVVDGREVKTIELEPECMPKKVSIPLNHGLQLKIIGGGQWEDVGVGNITVK